MSDQSGSSRLRALFQSALEDYEKQTNISLAEHPLAEQLESCHSVESISSLLQRHAGAVSELRGSDRISKSIKSIVSFLYKFSAIATFGDDIGLTFFSPAKAMHTGLGVLLVAVKGVVDSYDALINLLESMEHFLKRLDIYTRIPPTPAMDELVVKITVELISTLALATKELKQGRPRKFVKKLFGGEKDAEAVLQRLDRLTQDEARTTAAETLKVVYSLVQDMNGKTSGDNVREALEVLHEMASSMNKLKRDKLQQDIRNWLSPPDPWKNHNIALSSRLNGTAAWFVRSDIFSEWKSSGPSSLLLIHGKPGAGKSVLCSSIIQDIDTMRKCGLVTLAFFYHDFREDQKKDLRGLLSSVLFQLCEQSDVYYDILSGFYITHRHGAQSPTDDALVHCFQEILRLPGQAPIFLILDALDECSSTSSMPSPREDVLVLMQKLIESKLPNLRICITSRPEADIMVVLGPLTFHSTSLHDERGQMEDIESYIKSVVNMDIRNRRWTAQDKQLVIDVLTRHADGMFRWVYCQVVHLRGCHPGRIRHALADLPETLDETYERTLREINKADWELTHRLFQCVAVASRPLRVEELAEFLAFDFKEGSIPTFRKGWRPEDPVDAVRFTCPSFLSVINIGDSQIIQFSHFSVKEFLTSSRLAEAKHEISCYHVSMTLAQTLAARACLGILLHPDKHVTEDGPQQSPLARYAALHWVDHARFQDISPTVKDGINNLFDPGRPHLATWVSLHNAELPFWKLIKRGERPLPPNGTPLYYATVCGLYAFVKTLVVEHQHDVDSPCFDNLTPLHIASLSGHEEVARVLLDCNADVVCENEDKRTPLHLASKEGHLLVVCVLLERSAPTTARDKDGSTPLHLASQARHVEAPHVPDDGVEARTKDEDVYKEKPIDAASQIDVLSYMFSQGENFEVIRDLLQREVDEIGQDEDSSTPSHIALHRGYLASSNEHNGHVKVARFLVEHGADVAALDMNGSSPLHLASKNGQVEVTKLLVEHGADVAALDKNGSNPLHLASKYGQVEVAQLLVEHGADATSQRKDGWTPLHLASQRGHVGVARFLVEHGADATAQDKGRGTPLHLASFNGHAEVARYLVKHGADVTAQTKDGWTPLHLASLKGHSEVTRFLVEQGADVTVRKGDGWSPLHSASINGQVEVPRYLVEHGADVTAKEEDGWTPLHLASFSGPVQVARFLVEHGADVTAQNKDGHTPLHLASLNGQVDVACSLIEHGADMIAQDNNGWTPLHSAVRGGCEDVVRFLVAHGADTTARDNSGWTPREWAALKGQLEVMQVLNTGPRFVRLLILPFLLARSFRLFHAAAAFLLLLLLHDIYSNRFGYRAILIKILMAFAFNFTFTLTAFYYSRGDHERPKHTGNPNPHARPTESRQMSESPPGPMTTI